MALSNKNKGSKYVKRYKTFIKIISLMLAFLTLFNTVSYSFAEAVSIQPQKNSTKKLINADIGELPDKLPKEKLELKSKRTEYSTRYLNPDGSFTEEIFLDAKYYKDSDNQWKEIDNNLIESTKKANKLENKANKFKVSFSKQTGKEEIASIEKNDMSIGLIPVDADSVNSSVKNNEIIYKNIYKDTDVKYKVDGNKLKEDIILNKNTGKNTFSFELKLKGLKAIEKDGIIYFNDKNSQKSFYFEKPFMMDSNGKYSNDVTLTLRNEGGKTYVDVTADPSFLSDASTKYPVTIDPTINNWNVMSDTFISGSNPNSSYPSYASMYTGSTPSYGSTRSLIKFFLPSLPSDSKIIEASFNAYQTKVDATNASVGLYGITSSWTETATWNTQPTIKATAESAVTSNASNSYWQWYMTQLVKDWYSGSTPNYGFMLKQDNEGTSSYRAFNSVNAVTNTPRLTITYTVDPTGLEDFWGYTKDNVNPANGNLVMQQTDLAVSGRGIPLEITRTYNSRKSDMVGMFGYGWHSNVEAQLIDSGNGPIIFVDGDNTRHIFGEKVGGGYIAAGGVYLDLVKNSDSTYTITGVDGTKINFNTAGRIASIVDTNNNTTAYAYTSGKLTTITDASGRTVTITYGTNGYVSKITYTQAGRTVNYEYDASNNLTKVTDPAGKFITMNYDSDHNITGLTDQRSIKTTIGYDTANDRVSTISRPITIDGVVQTSTTSYSYDTQNLTTTVTDGENKKIQYTYNPNNNVVQVTENPLDPANKSVTTYTYDNYNNLTKVIVPNVNKEKEGTEDEITEAYVYSYDENGNITHVQLPEKQTATYSYDSQNNPTENIDFNGNSSSYSYDSNSNPLESTDANLQTAASRYWSNGNLWYSTNIMSAADNLITNSSMEFDANSDNWPDNWTKITEAGKTATYAWSGTAKFGNKSISISNPTGWAVAGSDYIAATVNDKYIVSGYVKTSNVMGSTLIKVDFYNSSDVWIDQTVSYGLKGTHDWTRVQAVVDKIPAGTAKIRVSVGMNAGTGTAYFDGMQLEKGTVLSAYNLVDNSSFEKTTNNLPNNWTTSGNFTANDKIDTSEKHIGTNSMKITGQSGVNKFVKQRINISGDSSTKLTLSGWSKQVGSNETGNYLMQVAIHYTDGTIDWLGNNFSRVEDGWQHVAAKIEPTSAFDWIEVYYCYYDQAGTAWFDAPRLEVGSSHTFNSYDVYNNYVTSVNDPMGNVSSFTYDAFGNVLTAKNPKNQTTAYSYDSRNLLTKVTDAKNGVTTYGYDNAGNRTTVTDARIKVTTYDYNEFNLVSKITNPLNQVTQFGYNKNGQNTKTIFPKGDTITSTYNALNRLEGIAYNGVQKWGYEYDANGNITKINNIAGGISTTNTYDKNDRITRVAEGANNRLDYGYDDNSNLTSLTLTAGTTSSVFGYSFDSLNQLTSLSRNSQNLAKFVYDERGNITSERFSNGTYTSYEYDGSNRLTAIKNYNAAGAVLNSYSYTYDANGNRTSVITSNGTINYKYDELNRLTQETLLDGTIISYEYDAAGNRTKKTAGSTATNYTYDNGNQLTAVNGQAYTYDVNGNLINNGAKTFVYNEVNQLTQVKDSSGNVIASYTYDDQGRRTSLTAWGETSKYYYSGDKVIYTTNGSNKVIAEFTYDPQGNPATMTYNGVTYYYHIDGHGNVTAMTDASGNTVAQYNYDAWGKILSQSGSMAAINPFRYAGYRYDEATGLYYLMARYYDPGVGRFISRDTFHGFEINPQSLNLYAYCANNPVMYIDPSGNYYISLTNMGKILLYVLGFNPIGATIVAIGLYKLKVLITAKMGLLGAKLGSFWGPVAAGALSFVFSASGLVVGGEIANALWDCYWQGKKGIEFGVKRNRWGYVYGLDIYAK